MNIFFNFLDRQINLFAQRKLYDDFFTEYQNILKECGIEEKYGKVPIKACIFNEILFKKFQMCNINLYYIL